MTIESFIANLPLWAFVLIVVWSLVWKAIALWKSARREQIVWFIVLIVVNTLGILEILYIFIFSRCCAPKTRVITKAKTAKPVKKAKKRK